MTTDAARYLPRTLADYPGAEEFVAVAMVDHDGDVTADYSDEELVIWLPEGPPVRFPHAAR